LDQRLASQMTDLVQVLQTRGTVRQDLDPGPFGVLLFNNLNQMFLEFVKDDNMPLEVLRRRVDAQTRPLAKLIAAGPAVH